MRESVDKFVNRWNETLMNFGNLVYEPKSSGWLLKFYRGQKNQ
jgi:hypothetical protein